MMSQQDSVYDHPQKYITSTLETPVEPEIFGNEEQVAKKAEKKARKRRNGRLMAALINSAGRIVAQIIGAIAGVALGIVVAGHLAPRPDVPAAQQVIPANRPYYPGAVDPETLSGLASSRIILLGGDVDLEDVHTLLRGSNNAVILSDGRGGYILKIELRRSRQ